MEFCRFRDFAVPHLGLSTCHPPIPEMRTICLWDSNFRASHQALCVKHNGFLPIPFNLVARLSPA